MALLESAAERFEIKVLERAREDGRSAQGDLPEFEDAVVHAAGVYRARPCTSSSNRSMPFTYGPHARKASGRKGGEPLPARARSRPRNTPARTSRGRAAPSLRNASGRPRPAGF